MQPENSPMQLFKAFFFLYSRSWVRKLVSTIQLSRFSGQHGQVLGWSRRPGHWGSVLVERRVLTAHRWPCVGQRRTQRKEQWKLRSDLHRPQQARHTALSAEWRQMLGWNLFRVSDWHLNTHAHTHKRAHTRTHTHTRSHQKNEETNKNVSDLVGVVKFLCGIE